MDVFTAERSTPVNAIPTDLHIIATPQLWVLALRHRGPAAVVEADPHAERHVVGAVALADLVADEATYDGATHRGGGTTVALADGVAQHATGDGTDHGTQGEESLCT